MSGAPEAWVTAPLPHVGAEPHLGYALDLVLADVLVRHGRQRGRPVALRTGTDENTPYSAAAARAAGISPAGYAAARAATFTRLADALGVRPDRFVRTSADPAHRRTVAWLWRTCLAAGDLYKGDYTGWFCDPCGRFRPGGDGGRCPEHGDGLRETREENWFFRMGRHAGALRAALDAGVPRVVPQHRKHEVIGLLDAGLTDFSVSRPAARAGGWGLPVPGDPGQLVHSWFDVLCGYLDGDAPQQELVHVIGKGILRYHAAHWPAILRSAGLPAPRALLVHEHITVARGPLDAADPVALADAYGPDALRWWLLREASRPVDVDFSVERMAALANDELAGGLGNLVHRTVTMLHRYRPGRPVPAPVEPHDSAPAVLAAAAALPDRIGAALDALEPRAATEALWALVGAGNRYVEEVAPWRLAARERDGAPGAALDEALGVALTVCRRLATALEPFLPAAAARIAAQCGHPGGELPPARPVILRVEPLPEVAPC
ncbi:methionine--tRNA ligase [Couchioplanes caeruleus]|uniref:methionine--tRNA ligase n=2 Tax=Couchioplanes caeruleus TaxID=56438 RepID=A0A1K0GSY7_9ACTN|nr:methionine--tRNA ligase [Couchioplanes caeruleus]OJF12395.1 hypothetical protein BG844_20745 [Couchioplanes caeruleus subsp. caeruleus]ROP29501.1 methionyl-tRNA synthetase [Couchioplanes caeruleus]